MSAEGCTVSENGSRLGITGIWVAPLAVLVGLWLWLAFSSGGYVPDRWLPPSLVLGLLGLVVSLLVVFPRRPGQLSLLVLALFACYGLWVALSAVWADSISRVWMESGRTFSYVLLFGLALVCLADPMARRMLRYLLMAATLAILVVCVWQLWSRGSIAGLFVENRLAYPVSCPNNAGALYLVGFWPLMWLAAGPEERAPIRGIALGLATGLLGLSIMTQSRGAVWSLGLSLVIMFAVSPARLRTIVYMLVPALLMVYEFPTLNRYWLEGPEAVGGSIGARTLATAAIIAAFMGMILALLERWVRVSQKMKTIFGTVILAAALAGAVYGSIALTSDVGGPLKWISQTWQHFTSQASTQSDEGHESRFTMVSSTGRVDIWRVAWKSFESAPVMGVGADNFVFQYDRLRSTQTSKPKQAHSLELQILGETGLVGGVLAFGGMILAVAGLMWPRCTAGWLGAREAWLRRRRTDTSVRDDPPTAEGEPRPVESSTRWCNLRWGNRPIVYGWEMALLAGSAYWLIHASVDWLWQVPGVTIPAMLFMAAGIASVDARALVLWPRVRRWLKIDGRRPPVETNRPPVKTSGPPYVQPTRRPESADQTAPVLDVVRNDDFFTLPRRSDQHSTKAGRRSRHAAKSQHAFERMQPSGLLSTVFRGALVALSLAVLVLAGLPYLSLQIQRSAIALAATDGVRAADRAESTRFLQPSDPGPYLTQAGIYIGAATAAAASGDNGRAGAVLDNLALSIHSFEAAIAREPADWSLRYRAGVATLNLLLATEYATGSTPQLEYPALIPRIPGLVDWSGLAATSEPIPAQGEAAGSLAADQTRRDIAAGYRSLSRSGLAELALDFLGAAGERNPLARQVEEAVALVRHLVTTE